MHRDASVHSGDARGVHPSGFTRGAAALSSLRHQSRRNDFDGTTDLGVWGHLPMLVSIDDVVAARAAMLDPGPDEFLVDTCARACHEFAEFIIHRSDSSEAAYIALEAMATAISIGDVASIQRQSFEVYLTAAAIRGADYALIEAAASDLFSCSPRPDRITLAVLTALARAIPSGVPKSPFFLEHLSPLQMMPNSRSP